MGHEVAETKAGQVNGTNGHLAGMKLFAGNANRELAQRVADYLNIRLGRLTATNISDDLLLRVVTFAQRSDDVWTPERSGVTPCA